MPIPVTSHVHTHHTNWLCNLRFSAHHSMQLSMFTLADMFTLDCMAFNNFLSKDLIKRCGLTYVDTPTYVVEVGDGRKLKCQGKCTNFMLEIQGLKICQDFFIFNIGGANVVLGLEWLASLKEVKADCSKLKLPIGGGDNQVTVVGDPTLSTTATSFKRLITKLQKGDVGYLVVAINGSTAERSVVVPIEVVE